MPSKFKPGDRVVSAWAGAKGASGTVVAGPIYCNDAYEVCAVRFDDWDLYTNLMPYKAKGYIHVADDNLRPSDPFLDQIHAYIRSELGGVSV